MKITANDWKLVIKASDFIDVSIEITEVGGFKLYSRTFNERKAVDIDDREHVLIL